MRNRLILVAMVTAIIAAVFAFRASRGESELDMNTAGGDRAETAPPEVRRAAQKAPVTANTNAPFEPAPTESAPAAPRVHLELTVENLDVAAARSAKIRIDRLPQKSATVTMDDSIEFRANSKTYVLDCSRLFADDTPRELLVSVETPAAKAVNQSVTVPAATIRAGETTVLKATIRLDDAPKIIGRIRIAGDPPLVGGNVSIIARRPFADVEQRRVTVLDSRGVAADGTFAFDTPQGGGALLLLVNAVGGVPTTRRIDAAPVGVTDLGDVLIEAGTKLRGQLRCGTTPLANVPIFLTDPRYQLSFGRGHRRMMSFEFGRPPGTIPTAPDTLVFPKRIQVERDHFDLSDGDLPAYRRVNPIEARTDEGGRFEVACLPPGKRVLQVAESAIQGATIHPEVSNAMSREVEAPNENLDIDLPIAMLRFVRSAEMSDEPFH